MEHDFLVRSSGTSEKVVLFFRKEYWQTARFHASYYISLKIL